MNVLDEINQQGVSIIISARNEFPQIMMTITGLMNDLDLAGITKYEFILVDNGSIDQTSTFWGFKKSNTSASGYDSGERGLLHEGILKIIFDPVLSNVGARTNGSKQAKYENIIFADAHIMVSPYTIFKTLETLNKFKGVIHAPVAWMGASSKNPRAGLQYSYKLGEKFWGTWNYAKVADTPFFIPITGHCWLAVKKDQFLAFGGYHKDFRVYGGGEPYLDTKYWLLGSNVMVDPRCLIYHLSAGRGYFWDQADLIHNQMLCAYTIAGEKWSERLLIAYLEKSGTDKNYVKKLYQEALAEGKEDREWILANQKYNFDEIMGFNKQDNLCNKKECKHPHVLRIWDKKNEELHNNHLSFVAVFDEWLNRLTDPEAIEIYKNSPYQR